MKKFASTFICVLLVALMVFSTVASATSVLDPTKTTASLTLYKYTTDKGNEEAETPSTPPVNDQVAVKGATYTAYKIASLNADGTFTVETAFADLKVDGVALSTLFTTDKHADNTGSLTYADTNAFEKYIPALRQEIENSNYVGASGTTDEDGKAEITNLALGVYLVIETVIPDNFVETSKPFLVQLPQWDQDAGTDGEWLYNVTAYPKNDPVDLEKVIVEKDKSKTHETTRAIGDIVDYAITVDVPYYGDLEPAQIAVIQYFLTDNMSAGLTFNNDVKVTVLGAPTATTLVAGTDFTVDTEDTTVITVDFVPAKVYAWQGYQFLIEYTATLNEDAVIGDANPNTAKLTFTTNPRTGKKGPNGEPEPDTDDTDEDSTKVYTYGMDLTKKFNNKKTNGTPDASAVEFTLSDGTANLQFVKLGAGEYLVVGADWAEKYVKDGKIKLPVDADEQTEYTVTTALNPSSTGKLLVNGLNVGTYTLTETKTVNGYSKLESDVTIVVTGLKDDTTNKLNGLVGAKANGSALDANERDGGVGTKGVFEIEINNVLEQFNLPLTGGAGLLMFTIGGGIVIAGAIILFSLLRKKKAAK